MQPLIEHASGAYDENVQRRWHCDCGQQHQRRQAPKSSHFFPPEGPLALRLSPRLFSCERVFVYAKGAPLLFTSKATHSSFRQRRKVSQPRLRKRRSFSSSVLSVSICVPPLLSSPDLRFVIKGGDSIPVYSSSEGSESPLLMSPDMIFPVSWLH